MKKKTQKHSQVARARYHNDRTKNPAKYGIARKRHNEDCRRIEKTFACKLGRIHAV